ncbi:MAG: hypothetical protein ACKVJK_20775 [Methylophagaceae bacterium]|jgi:ABC-type uncharacterized transport system permease subunit|tara:strand:+ start:76 stop:237 length:162 start_codon:yes stop_codon:yes gene_type:complete
MKLPTQLTGLGTMGLSGIVLMYLHITNDLTGWAWPLLYVILIMGGIGQENTKK